jgi:hypothetical protein
MSSLIGTGLTLPTTLANSVTSPLARLVNGYLSVSLHGFVKDAWQGLLSMSYFCTYLGAKS